MMDVRNGLPFKKDCKRRENDKGGKRGEDDERGRLNSKFQEITLQD